MARSSELIDFRRAFWWLLGGVLIPSISLVAFGVVAVANERAAVERRLSDEYVARLRLLDHALRQRLDSASRTLAMPGAPLDPLLLPPVPLTPGTAAETGLAVALGQAGSLPLGGHLFASADRGGDRHLYALARVVSPSGEAIVASEVDLRALAEKLDTLSVSPAARDRATFHLLAAEGHSSPPFVALKRLVSEVGKGDRATTVARLALEPPLNGFELSAELPGDNPAAALAFRNRSLYIALLTLLYTSIGVGFGLTLREMWRATRLSRLKTDFVANISHELRTPLTSVRLFAETLQSGRASGAEVQECLDLLAKEAERLSVLVERLLDWSRLESGRRPLHRERIELSALLDHVGEVFRAQQLGASYELTLDENLPTVDVDRDAITQVVLNLLHNAVKYTGKDKRIRLRARRAGRDVAIEVEDNGPGVRPQDKKRIFEQFYRADDLLSRRTEGTGLGLAIAKRIVEWHGGKIEVSSRAGEGSTFRVLLPVEVS
jgi:two-component system, OmpR family, phosphate regulon sensor histidine kinase PhoR